MTLREFKKLKWNLCQHIALAQVHISQYKCEQLPGVIFVRHVPKGDVEDNPDWPADQWFTYKGKEYNTARALLKELNEEKQHE